MNHVFATALLLIAASSAFAQEREWLLDVVDEDAFMVFGVPDTNDVGLSFWCKIGSAKLKLFVPEGSEQLKPDQDTTFTANANGETFKIAGRTSDNMATGRTSVEADLALDHPLLNAISKTERLEIDIKNHHIAVPMGEADFGSLLRVCAKQG